MIDFHVLSTNNSKRYHRWLLTSTHLNEQNVKIVRSRNTLTSVNNSSILAKLMTLMALTSKKKKKSTELKNIEAVAGLPAYFLVAEVPTTPIGFLLALSKRNCKASVKQCTYKQRNCHKLNQQNQSLFQLQINSFAMILLELAVSSQSTGIQLGRYW